MADFLDDTEQFLDGLRASVSLQQIHDITSKYHGILPSATAEERNDALYRLTAELENSHPLPGSKIALTCGALVEQGGDPSICGSTLLQTLPDMLEGAIRFHDLCFQKAEEEGLLSQDDTHDNKIATSAEDERPDEESDENAEEDSAEEDDEEDDEEGPSFEELAQRYIADIAEEDPYAAYGFLAERDVSLATIAHLARSKELRAEARTMLDTLLHPSIAQDDQHGGGYGFLTKMLLVLDDEPLLILDTNQMRGYRATMSGISDNFTLNAILMGRLVGDPADGWIKNDTVDTEAIRQSLLRVYPENAPSITGAFNLWNWTAVQPDGTLPDAQEGAEYWIWNEGIPWEIIPFEGTRIVVLGPMPYERTWNGGLPFEGMTPQFVVHEKLSENTVRDWLIKLGNAPRPDPEDDMDESGHDEEE